MLSGERQATIEDLRTRKLFADVPIQIIKRLLSRKKVRISCLQARSRLKLRRGKVEFIYIIVSGYLEVRLRSQLIKKGKNFLLAFRGPGQIVGEMRAIAKGTEVAFISSSEPCELIEIPSEALAQIAEADWRIYRNIAELLIEKTYQERKRTEVIQMPEGEAQVAQALLNFLDERGAEIGLGKEKIINGNIYQSNIADYIGCDRTTVAKNLKALKNQGVIDYPKPGRSTARRFTICDSTLLARIARHKRAK